MAQSFEDEDPKCRKEIKKAFDDVKEKLKSEKGRKELQEIFKYEIIAILQTF